jgi:hypothetical protein
MAYKRVTLIKVRQEFAVMLARNIERLMIARRTKHIARTNRLYGEYALRVQVTHADTDVIECVCVSVCVYVRGSTRDPYFTHPRSVF